ncbi:MAG: TonB-dependent receptor [Sphingomonadales bacterium]|nr:TonB-dependent receptor [Sphingomonadales bacterium]
MKIKPLVAYGIAGAMTAMAGPALAQQASAPAAASTEVAVSPDQPAGGFGDIVVTAQRRSERLSEVPLTITAQTGADLARQGITNSRELQIAVPGLTFASQGAFAEPAIRGVQTTISQAGADSPIAIYLDGFYQPNQVGNIFDLADVERVEVLKGPQGTLFGRNATGGAISIHTLEPSFDLKGHISLSDGVFVGNGVKTANEVTAKGYINIPLVADVLAASVSGFTNLQQGHLTNDVDGSRYGRVKSYLVRGKLLFKPSDGVSFLLSGMYLNRRDDDASTFLPLDGNTVAARPTIPNADPALPAFPNFPDAVYGTKPWHTAGELGGGGQVKTKQWQVSLKSTFDVGGYGTLTSLTGYQKSHPIVLVDVDAAYSPSCLAIGSCITPYVVDYGPDKTFQEEMSFTSEKFGSFSFVAGIFIYLDRHRIGVNLNTPIAADGSIDLNVPGFFYTDAKVDTDAYAGFGEINFDVTDRLRLIGGLRYSSETKTGTGAFFQLHAQNAPRFASHTWNSFTPRISARYRLTDQVNVYATYSKGFKSGILDASNFSPTPVDPETIASYEAGVKINTRGFSLSASGFYYDYKNLQAQFFSGTTVILKNAANARLYGGEVDATVKLNDALQVRAAGSWLPHAEYKKFPGAPVFGNTFDPTTGLLQGLVIDASGQRMLKAPKFTGNFSVDYSGQVANGRLEAHTTLYYSSSFNWELTQRVKTREYITLGANLSYQPDGSSLKFGIFGKNLTNKAYIDGTVLSAYADAVHYAPPRELGVSLDYSF